MIKAKNSQATHLNSSLYKKYLSIIVDLLKRTKEFNCKKYFDNSKKKCTAVWKRINEIIYWKSKVKAREPNCFLINVRAVSHPKDIGKHFNDYLQPKKRNFSDNLKNPNAESFLMTPTTPDEISDLNLQF